MTFWAFYTLLEWLARLVMVPVVLHRRWLPTTALAWLSVIFLLPEAGIPFYFMLSGNRLAWRRLRRHRRLLHFIRTDPRKRTRRISTIQSLHLPPAEASVIAQAEASCGMPVLGGNEVELLGEVTQVADRLVADIEAARHHVHLLYYIYASDAIGRRVGHALARAAARGVECRLLADAAGSRLFLRRGNLAQWLADQGVQVHAALPVDPLRRRLSRIDLRNHRKLAIIDGAIAYTGSHNIIYETTGWPRRLPWLDLTGRFRGPIVSQLQSVFLDDWFFDTDEDLDDDGYIMPQPAAGSTPAMVVATGPTQESGSLARVLLAVIYSARRKIIITSPYLVPDEPMILALLMAANRGVEVNLVVPQVSDMPVVSAAGRAYFEPLLEEGVRIYQYCHGMLHAKTITVDDSFALLGSSNLDMRSFYLNFEINALMYGPQATRELRFAQMRYIHECEPVGLAQWRQRPRLRRYVDSAAALLSPLL